MSLATFCGVPCGPIPSHAAQEPAGSQPAAACPGEAGRPGGRAALGLSFRLRRQPPGGKPASFSPSFVRHTVYIFQSLESFHVDSDVFQMMPDAGSRALQGTS